MLSYDISKDGLFMVNPYIVLLVPVRVHLHVALLHIHVVVKFSLWNVERLKYPFKSCHQKYSCLKSKTQVILHS